MRIVIDLQGAQSTGSRNRGIGRYSTALSQAIIRNRKNHDVHLVLNGAFADSVEEIRTSFQTLLPADKIHVFEPLPHIGRNVIGSQGRRRASEAFREHFIRCLQPDVIHVSSLFEGFADNAVCSVGGLYTDIPTSVTLYDLIPLINREKYLEERSLAGWYYERLDDLRRANACFAISESARQEAIEYLGLSPDAALNISTAADPQFQKIQLSVADERKLRQKYGLDRPYVMYTGGIDLRKNVEGLIKAYARLPKGLRRAHQLAIVCSAAAPDKERLHVLANSAGLQPGELILTGFVSEQDLIGLYNLAKLFVFPSWHEGFGLPALEAMKCGAPVIGSDRSSIPEVIGLADALFDPFDEEDIAKHIMRGLEDEPFRELLRASGVEQAERFSWGESGKRAVSALENMRDRCRREVPGNFPVRPRLAVVSPMPPARTGIAEYTAELLPALARHYEIDAVVPDEVVDEVGYALCPEPVRVIGSSDFLSNWKSYDRILYHFGNSEFHSYMFPLLARTSGVVVLHDLFLSGAISYRQWHNHEHGAWLKELYRAHGYIAASEPAQTNDPFDIVWKYPCSRSVIEQAQQVIVHSKYAKDQAQRWYGDLLSQKITVIPMLREPHNRSSNRAAVRDRVGILEDEILVCAFGLLGPMKCNLELIEAWSKSSLARDRKCKLVFVGQNDSGEYGREILRKIQKLSVDDSVSVTGWADRQMFEAYLDAADFAVQLRTLSRGETSLAILDCMSRGVPLVVNANGSMAEVSEDAAIILPDSFELQQLVTAIELLRSDDALRERMSAAGPEIIKRDHSPEACAAAYRNEIESAGREDEVLSRLVSNVGRAGLSEAELGIVSTEVARSLAEDGPRLLIDISVLAQSDAKTGIQRVVRNLLSHLIGNGAGSYRVEPIYVDPEARGFRFARNFTSAFADVDIGGVADEMVSITPRDVVLMLDLNPFLLDFVEEELARLRRQRTKMVFVVYDLLPIQFPEMFPEEVATLHRRWLDRVSEGAAAVCISEAVATELRAYVAEKHPESSVAISSFPLGAGLETGASPVDRPTRLKEQLGLNLKNPTFLAVGTIEPRKGYDDILDAFEKLWSDGQNVNLRIVGRPGWKCEKLVKRIERLTAGNHPIIWLRDADDAQLEAAYDAATCLIAASYGEGFGLPIIEAALHNVPVIARDIPVFREVGGNGATYFSGKLADSIRQWIEDREAGTIERREQIELISWDQSSEALLGRVLATGRDEGQEPKRRSRA